MSLKDFFPLEKSEFYQVHLLEIKAIEVHKWYLSEKAGYDVGMDYARYNWVMAGHRRRWLDQLYKK